MMNQRTSPEADRIEPGAGITRRAMMTAAPSLGAGAMGLGLGASVKAKAQEPTEVGRLYAEWKRIYESPDWRTVDDDAVGAMADTMARMEHQLAATQSVSIEDVYRKIAVADAHGALGTDFDILALAKEARGALGDDAPQSA